MGEPNTSQAMTLDQETKHDGRNEAPLANKVSVPSPNNQQWHSAFPPPTSSAPLLSREDALSLLLSPSPSQILIIDVRRTDYEGGVIRGSLNIPAQGFWWNRGRLLELARKSGGSGGSAIGWVVFTCGSSNGRGPRCAGWFLDAVLEAVEEEGGERKDLRELKVRVLEGGIKGWVKAGEEFTGVMDGFREEYWRELFRAQEDPDAAKNVAADVAKGVGAGDVVP